MFRLADYPPSEYYEARLNELLQLCENKPLAPLHTLVLQLDEVRHRFGWAGEYETFLHAQVLPLVRKVLGSLGETEREMLARHLMLFFSAYADAVASECSRNTRRALAAHLGSCSGALQECALSFVLNRPEIDVVLLGMRRPRYVAQALEAFPSQTER